MDSYRLYIYTFYGLCMILVLLIIRIAMDRIYVKEGMEDIGKDITDAFNGLGNDINKAGDGISEVIDKVKQIFDDIGKIGQFLGDVFDSIGSYLECSIFYVSNIFTYCIMYYFIYIAGMIIYCPFTFLFWATGTQYIENSMWDILGSINDFMVDITGFNIVDYIYPDKCYKCNIKPLPKLNL